MRNNVIDYLYEIIGECPDKLAYCDDQTQYTFKHVYDYSRAIATFIHNENIYRKPVVIFMNKSPKEIVSFFGTIQAGCFYVPIDEEMPAGRIKLILDNVQSPLMICDSETLAKSEDLGFTGKTVLYDDIITGPVDDAAIQQIHDSAIDTDPIYIVFTSGSTGIPKGVAACHRSVLDYIEQLSDTLGFSSETIFGNQTPLYFDACLKELYPTLKFGATTWLIPKSLFMFPVKLVEYMNEHQVNTICWVVSALTMISAFNVLDVVKPEYLKTVAFGSEVFPIKQYRKWKKALPEASFTNLYGPTEGTGMCCFYHVNREFELDEVMPIGRPFKNTEILLLTEENKLAAPGEVGEICIRGTSVTLGYYNNPEKTSECYTQNPLNTAYPEIIYRTGDLARLNEYGELVFISRKDFQIKHMGHRIELGEIEVNVNMQDGVKISGCVYDQVKSRIVLYYVGDVSESELAGLLKDKLPRYMLPNSFKKLDTMPLTANGKVDRVTLKNYMKEQK